MRLKRSLTCRTSAVSLLCALGWVASAVAGGGCLEIRQGYFWDPVKQGSFIPRGIAYQLWNPPVGANQSFEQLHYDLVEFKRCTPTPFGARLCGAKSRPAPGIKVTI